MLNIRRSDQNQEKFFLGADKIKAPINLGVKPENQSCVVTWRRRPGKVDGFIILLGTNIHRLEEHARVPQTGNLQNSHTIAGLENDREYFVTVIAYKDDQRSETPHVYRFKSASWFENTMSEIVFLLDADPGQTAIPQDQLPAPASQENWLDVPSEPAGALRSPTHVQIQPYSESFKITWNHTGGVEKFIVMLGEQKDNITEHMQVPVPSNGNLEAEVTGLANDRDYYVTVVAVRDEEQSDFGEVWRIKLAAFFEDAELRPVFMLDDSDEAASPATTQTTPEPIIEQPAPRPAPQTARPSLSSDAVARCASCGGEVHPDPESHLYKCWMCNKEYVQRSTDNQFVATSLLPNGACSCCNFRSPLIPSGEPNRLACQRTGNLYVPIAGRPAVPLDSLDYGFCDCCQPGAPLMLNSMGQMVCSTHRDHLHVEEGGRWKYVAPEAPTSSIHDIDQALSNATASMRPGGLVSADGDRPQRRRRRRRQ